MEELEESPEYQDTKWDNINEKYLEYLIYKELEPWDEGEE